MSRTKGEVYAGLNSDHLIEPLEVGQIRGVIATVIDNLDHLDHKTPYVARLVALAQTKFEEACMFAVKAYYMSQEQE